MNARSEKQEYLGQLLPGGRVGIEKIPNENILSEKIIDAINQGNENSFQFISIKASCFGQAMLKILRVLEIS